MTIVGFVTLTLMAATARDLAQSALSQAVTAPARIEVIDTSLAIPQGCVIAAVTPEQRPTRSGVIALAVAGRAAGQPCSGKGWARVRLFAPALSTTRAVRSGDALQTAVELVEREVLSDGRLDELPQDARAAMTLSRGTVLEPRHLKPDGPAPGSRITVVVVSGDLHIEQEGVALACPGRSCARLANGKRLEGRLLDGKLMVTP